MKNLDQSPVMILACGGTFDKLYGFGAGVRDLTFGDQPAAINILRQVGSYLKHPVVPLMAKDSLDMDDVDRATIAGMCAAIPQRRILITHGTDTLINTAETIAAKVKDKTIILTAAGQPAIMKGSDADFNLGFALAAALLKDPGVWIAINAMIYAWSACKKNPYTGVFEPFTPEEPAKA